MKSFKQPVYALEKGVIYGPSQVVGVYTNKKRAHKEGQRLEDAWDYYTVYAVKVDTRADVDLEFE